MKRFVQVLLAAGCLLLGAAGVSAADATTRYALILSDPPAAKRISRLNSIRSAVVTNYRDQIRAAQISLKGQLAQRNIRVTGSAQTVLNAIFVDVPKARVNELRALPGVKAVAPLHRFRLHLNRAVELQNIPAAWQALGGTGNAGAGVKVAIIDTGIDQNHPAFRDSSLSTPSGFPKCTDGVPADCNFTNSKVIVARSYVAELASGALSGGPSESRPDDVTPRDHIGHGTALAMIVAGQTVKGPAATITGMAPKAWLGSYKVFGSPGVNDFTGGDVLIRAIDDAVSDGMDIAVLSLGSPAFTGPFDTGAICGAPSGTPCDAEAVAVDNAAQAGMLVVASAGNSGDSGIQNVSLNTVESPATVPSAIAAGASTNSHQFVSGLRVVASDAGAAQFIPAVFGNGPVPSAPITAPLFDVTKLDPTGFACSALPPGSLSGTFAIINRSPQACTFVEKVDNAQNAGAVAVVLVDTGEDLSPFDVSNTGIPAVMIGNAEGSDLRTYLASHPNTQATLDPAIGEVDTSVFNTVAGFSSRGPSITYELKPDLAAVGTNVYMATQTADPNGPLYDASGFTVASGTSFSAPMAAGVAALVKQKNPGFTVAQLKSAVVGTATQDLTDGAAAARVTAAGNGKLNGGNAVQTTVTTDPATISFGALGQTTTLPVQRALAVHYSGTAAATLSLSISGNRPPALNTSTLSFTQGSADQQVTLTLSGSTPPPGIYEGALTIQGGGTAVRVPYLYLVGDGVPADIIPITGQGFDGRAGQPVTGGLAFKVVDQYGVSVPNVPVTFTVNSGGGSISSADSKTDVHGIAFANAVLGSQAGTNRFTGRAGVLDIQFTGVGRDQPVINGHGIVNAASFREGVGLVPGSYVSIFGTALSDTYSDAFGTPLPLAISETSVSFEVPSANISIPGRLLFAGDQQVNVQVPWELNGQTSVKVRVNVGETTGQVFNTRMALFSPGIYTRDDGTAAALDTNNREITSSNGAARGAAVQLFVNGLGAVDNPPATGENVPMSPLVHTTATPSVTVGGKAASVEFSGLAPGFPGLNQINFRVPQDAPTGMQPVVVTIGGVSSPAVNIWVQ